MDDENGWPILDFDAFPNGMISGLTLSEINECMSIHNITPSLQELDEAFLTREKDVRRLLCPQLVMNSFQLQKETTFQEEPCKEIIGRSRSS